MRFVIALLCLGGVVLAQDSQEQQTETLRVEKEWMGGSTAITTAEFHRVMDADAWAKLWERHTGKKERAPEVDFTKHMVVACFLGPVTYDEVALYSVRKTKDEIVFGVTVEEKDCCDFSAKPLYYMAAIPRSTLKLSIISRVKQDLDVDPKKDKVLKELDAVSE